MVLALAGGFVLRIFVANRSKNSLERTIQAELESARSEAKEAVLEAKNKAASIIDEAQKEERDRKQELRRVEERLIKKEDSLDVDRKAIETEEKHVKDEIARVAVLETEVKGAHEKIVKEMERVGQLTREEARVGVMKEFEDAHRDELAQMLANGTRES